MQTFIFCVISALALLDTILIRTSILLPFDSAIVVKLYQTREAWPALILPFFFITHLGSDLFLIALSIALVCWCLHQEKRNEAVWFIATVLFARVFGWVAKLLLHSPRPDIIAAPAADHFSGYGFPSGHALMSIVVYGAAALLWVRHQKKEDIRIPLGCAALVALIGFSRVYLGAHWANDVAGGLLYGASILSGSELLRKSIVGKSSP